MNTDKHRFYKINLCANAPGTYWLLRCFLRSPKSNASALFQVAAFGATAFDFGLRKKQTTRSATLSGAEANMFRARLPAFICVPKNALPYL
jgi:hypothetical protein